MLMLSHCSNSMHQCTSQQPLYVARILMLTPALQASLMLKVAAAAFGLNMSVFLLIGKTSALTMNVAGVIKDWMLIGLSVLLFHAEVRNGARHAAGPCAASDIDSVPDALVGDPSHPSRS